MNTPRLSRDVPIILLAGGRSSRMGRDKTRLMLNGETLLNRAYRRFSGEFASVFVSVAPHFDPLPELPQECLMPDIITGLGPASGLHAALMRFDSAFLVAVDMPLADPQLAKELIDGAYGFDAVAAVAHATSELPTHKAAEPAFAFYQRTVLPELIAAIEGFDYSLNRLLHRINTRYVELPPDTLLNINFPADYERLVNAIK